MAPHVADQFTVTFAVKCRFWPSTMLAALGSMLTTTADDLIVTVAVTGFPLPTGVAVTVHVAPPLEAGLGAV